jgi:RHS repeat-associated protein
MLDEDADLNWLDYGFRNYDPQIGRFVQQDPLKESYQFLTPYQYGNDDPINNIDLNGLEGVPANVAGFIKNLGSGVENVSSRLMTAGKNIGGWAVRYTQNGVAYTHIFKAVVASTSQVGILATVKSLILAEVKLVDAHIRGSEEYRKGALEGVADWAKEGVKSGFNLIVTEYHLYKGMLTHPSETVDGVKKALILKKDQVLKTAYKIGGGDFSDFNDELVKFSQLDDRGVGKFAGKQTINLAVIVVTGGEGKVAGEVGEGLSILEKGVLANQKAGNALRDELALLLEKEGREVATEVSKRTPLGWRFIDIEVSQSGKVLGGIETKLGGSRYRTLQRLKDNYLTAFGEWDGSIKGLYKVSSNGRYPVNLVRGPL